MSADFEFVIHPLADLGDEDFPDAGGTHAAHGMKAAIPAVEIADDTDALGARRPNGERKAFDPLVLQEMGPHLFMELLMVPFPQEIKVHFPQGRPKGVGIPISEDFWPRVFHLHAVRADFLFAIQKTLEKARGRTEGKENFLALTLQENRNRKGVRAKHPHAHARLLGVDS